MADAPAHPLQQTLKDLERAYGNFFAKRADFPRFSQGDRFRYPDPRQIKREQANSRLFVPKLGGLRSRNIPEALGLIKNTTICQSSGQWGLSIQIERKTARHVLQGEAVGIDLGIARFAMLSDGTFYAPHNSFNRHQDRLRKTRQALSHKTKCSNRCKKAKADVQRLYAQIGNARRDYLRKTTTTISQSHATGVVEDLQVRNVPRSAAGTANAPGPNVRAKSGLSRNILGRGRFECRSPLDDERRWNGGMLIAAPPHNTSRTCSACGHIAKESGQTQAKLACMACGYEENADVVSARNVWARGQHIAACGEPAQSHRSATQEPTEATWNVAQCHA